MAEKTQPTPTDKQHNPESPTTAHSIDFDDDAQETGTTTAAGDSIPQPLPSSKPTKTVSFQEEEAPKKPPRPMDHQAQAEATLKEAFPSIDEKVIRAVLTASGGQVEPAFNALLGMSDPNYKAEEAAPPRPAPRPGQPRSQLEQDELYARQLAAHYQSSSGYDGYGSRTRGDPPVHRQREETGLKPNELYDDRERSFFDDDLPEIKRNIEKGFMETQTKVNQWITNLKKKIDGEDDDDLYSDRPGASTSGQGFGPTHTDTYRSRPSTERSRRSGDRDRYDADAPALSDDFTALQMHDNEIPPEKPPRRPQANPDLFKPTPTAPQKGPVDEVEALYAQPPTQNRQPSPGSGGKTKKWQAPTSVAPNPEGDDHDPFSLGDSDDEEKAKDVRADDTERLKKAAAEVSSTEETSKLEPAKRSGSVSQKDKTAEELLAGKDTKDAKP